MAPGLRRGDEVHGASSLAQQEFAAGLDHRLAVEGDDVGGGVGLAPRLRQIRAGGDRVDRRGGGWSPPPPPEKAAPLPSASFAAAAIAIIRHFCGPKPELATIRAFGNPASSSTSRSFHSAAAETPAPTKSRSSSSVR